MSIILIILIVLLFIPFLTGIIALIILLSRREKKNDSVPVPDASPALPVGTLAAALKEQRIRCGITQEFVAEQLDVSRQAVSKWENGTSEPSTANLMALAQLYGTSVDALLRYVR